MRGRTVAFAGALTALAFALSYLERLLPLELPIPGFKLGLANIVTLLALYRIGFRYALLITIIRCALSSLLFAGAASFAFSIAGGLLSVVAMDFFRRFKCFSPFGVSIAGAAAHNAGQVAAAALIMSTGRIFSYLSLLLPVSVATGFASAFAYTLLDRALPQSFLYKKGG